MTLHVRFYSKPGCHLCEQTEADLARLNRQYPHQVDLIDITRDAELMARYGERIPVLMVDGMEYAAPLSVEDVERALSQALKQHAS
jgi:glutaredoxin